jgi:hypothetical protein
LDQADISAATEQAEFTLHDQSTAVSNQRRDQRYMINASNYDAK